MPDMSEPTKEVVRYGRVGWTSQGFMVQQAFFKDGSFRWEICGQIDDSVCISDPTSAIKLKDLVGKEEVW